MTIDAHRDTKNRQLLEVAGLFLKLGFTAFGGPAAHVGLMHNEVVQRRGWLDDQEFLDLMGATNLIPGPNSTEMAIHVGFHRAGWKGLIVGGLCFVAPATLIVLALAWLYVRYGSLPQAQWVLHGIQPVMIAVIAQALWTLGRRAAKTWQLLAAGVLVLAIYEVLHVNEILLLLGGGLLIMLYLNWDQIRGVPRAGLLPPFGLVGLVGATMAPFSLSALFLTFLKIGAVLYGSGYVLLAFLRADFVVRLGWLTDRQLLDAIAAGQITPGPLFTSATFIGYLLGGVPGALLGTLGIFLPSFIFVAISNPLIPKMRRSPWIGGLLDGINVTSLSLMAAVTIQLARTTLVDWWTALLALASLALLLRYKVNATWLIVAGAAIGVLASIVGWR